MTLEVPASVERELQELVNDGEFPDVGSAVEDAIRAWRNERAFIDAWWDGLGAAGQKEVLDSLESDDDEFIEVGPEFFEAARERARNVAARAHGS